MKAILLALLAATFAGDDTPPAITIQAKAVAPGQPVIFSVEGADKNSKAILASLTEESHVAALQVFILAQPSDQLPPDAQSIFGKYTSHEGKLTFQSRYPASPGATYRAVVRLPGGGKTPWTKEITVPAAKKQPSTKVAIIYPTADVLPENLLKFYVHFSAPMSTGEAYKHIALETSSGQKIELPFLEIAEELWDKTNTRLTLLLDPGRIKHGLVPREEEGPILEAGQAYRFRVMADWPDAEGAPLIGETVKEFKVSGQDATQPAPTEWKIISPRAGGKSPIVIDLLEPLDHAIVARGIRVFDAKGIEVNGQVTLARQEREWRFTPAAPWQSGAYELRIDDVIEDLVGNNITRPFELDRFDEVKAPEEKRVKLKVEIH